MSTSGEFISDSDSIFSFSSDNFDTFLGKKISNPRSRFSYTCHIRENHGQQLYGIAVSPYIKNSVVLSTVGSNRCTIYKLTSNNFELVQCYSDGSSDENYYCCTWMYDTIESDHLVAAAGKKGSIQIISPKKGCSIKELNGHGNAINELTTHPIKPMLLLSASKDYTLRLWNVKSGVCIAVFGGPNGHCDEALSVDFDLTGEKIISSGIDHTIKIWGISDKENLKAAIKSSDNYDPRYYLTSFRTIKIHYPDFSTKDIHSNYVDSVRWFGDFVISKSCENIITLWKAGDLNSLEFGKGETDVSKIRDFRLTTCNVWFMKLTLDWNYKWLAAGNQTGKIYVWNLEPDIINAKSKILQHPKCTSFVRQIAFSPDNLILLAVCDDATVWRWDYKNA